MLEIRLSSVLGRAFHGLAADVFKHGHTHYDLSGGRGSLKSSAVSLLVPLLVISNPSAHAVVLRKVGNTLRDSVYAQYLWAIGELGMAAYWDAKVQPMELIYRPTGQKIMFRGADDPMKIKSIKVPFGYIAITHFEEKDQFAGRGEIRTILQSTMRGGSKFWNFESYNPPISRDNWANKDSLEERSDRLCHKSTYLEAPVEWLGEQFIAEAEHLKAIDERAYQHEYLGIPVGTDRLCHKSTYLEAPVEWLGEQFIAEAEHLKAIDERAYQHEYLGIPVGTGGNVFDNLELRDITDAEIASFDRIYQGVDCGNVFDNLELRDITDAEIASFDRIYQGVDWGWFPDPFAFVRVHYDRARETIYFVDEIYQNKLTNEESANRIKEKGYTDAYITCDSAEPKSAADYRALGLPAQQAVKGAGSVDYGMKWLQRRKIVIDRRRTPNVYKEFVGYEYERNRDGEIISGYPDYDNHTIDATRYALERIYKRMGVTA